MQDKTVFVSGKPVVIGQKNFLAQGGEAEIYRIDSLTVLKLYKDSGHQSFADNKMLQLGAQKKILSMQKKLPAFPKTLPKNVISPIELVTDKTGKVIGYTMLYVQNAHELFMLNDPDFKHQNAITNQFLSNLYANIHQTVSGIHRQQVVIGDFNDLNVLFKDTNSYFVDADSMQFGKFPCEMYFDRFVDPMICVENSSIDPTQPAMLKKLPHSYLTDWYAFTTMVFSGWMNIDPYFGGIYRPKDKTKMIAQRRRALHRISVFDAEVAYPPARVATPLIALHDEVRDYFEKVYTKDLRGIFPEKLLKLPWNTCKSCGMEHMTRVCPVCNTTVAISLPPTVSVVGNYTIRQILTTTGRILYFGIERQGPVYVVHENDSYYSGSQKILEGRYDPTVKIKRTQTHTTVSKNNVVIQFDAQLNRERYTVSAYRDMPQLDSNGSNFVWIDGDKLLIQDTWAPRQLGTVLQNHTAIWTGKDIGFGMSYVGDFFLPFLFRYSPGINDVVECPRPQGTLLDVVVKFGKTSIWIFFQEDIGGEIFHRCTVLDYYGKQIAHSLEPRTQSEWLPNIKSGTLIGDTLLTATNEGIKQVKIQDKLIFVAKTFSGSEQWVDKNCVLYAGFDSSLYVLSGDKKTVINIKI